MFSKVAVVALAIFAVAQAGQEAPPAKAVTYNVPSVAKVSYPGPTVTKSVETYSAPSIEKTTLITRTITAPLNAPAVKSVSYSAPAAPVAAVAAAPVAAVAAAPAQAVQYAPAQYAAAPVQYATAQYAAAPAQVQYAAAPAQVQYAAAPAQIQYAAAPQIQYAAHAPAHIQYAAHAPAAISKSYAAPTLSLASPQLAYAAAPALSAYGGSIGGATVYSAPSLGYSLGVPAYAAYAAQAPVAEYGAPVAAKAGYA